MSLRCFQSVILVVLMPILFGCTKLVTVSPPTSQLVTTSVFNSDNTAIAAQLAVYTQMQAIPWTQSATTGLSADELNNFSTGQLYIDLYKNNLNAQSDASSLFWTNGYNLIYQENAILQNAHNAGISNFVGKLLTGEASFMRALWYFNLTNWYGDVPLVTTTDYTANSLMSRIPKAQVMQQIILDLKNAQNYLSTNYLDATDSVVTADRVRPTTWAASALLARAYLYNGNYDSAEAQATSVISDSSLFQLCSLDSVFLKNSKEAIWQILPASTAVSTPEGNNFILISLPGGGGLGNSSTISTQLFNAFENGDERKAKWIGAYINGADTFYFPYKYKNNTTATSLREYSMVLRLGEQYLIRAEARAKQNNLSGAINDINRIRTRAGLPGLNPVLDQTGVLAAIAHERQVELFTEGHRWFDLKRTGAVDSVMSIVTPLKAGIPWNTMEQLYPLPLADVQADINLAQNPGY